jgi:hypothetical protein|tara:strand:+ start:24 stop:899 length:876 start_codon:yes stop_codon:yes gene_type:complete
MTWVIRVGNQTLRIFAANASEARQRMAERFPGETISSIRQGGRSGDANFRLISPTSVDADGNPFYGPKGQEPPSPQANGGGMGGNGGGGFAGPNPDDIGTGITIQAPIRPGLEQQSMRGAFQEFLRGTSGVGPNPLLANFAQGQFNPARAAFAAQQQAGLTPDVDEASQFQDFLSRAGGFGNRQLASRAIQDIAGALQGQGSGGLAGQERLMQLIDPETENQAAELFGLAQMTNTISPLVRDLRNTLAGNQQDAVFGEYARQRARGNSQNFAQFLAGRGFGGRDFASRLGF